MNRFVLAAPVVGLLPAPAALAQNKADPTPPPAQATVAVAIGDRTYNLDPSCAYQASIDDRRIIFGGGTIDTVQGFRRTSSGFIPDLPYQTADVGLEKFNVGDVPCLGRGQ